MPSLRGALSALDGAGVLHCVRNNGQRLEALQPADDLDVLVRRRDLRAADAALRGAGFHRLPAPGHRGHRFYVAVDDDGVWRKVDVVTVLRYGDQRLPVEPVLARRRRVDGVWVVSEDDEQAHRARRAAGLREPRTRWRALARRRPAGLRRRGPVVAVLGPDGAGKGSTLAGARAQLPVGTTVVYLGNRRPRSAAAAPPSGAALPPAGAPPSAAATTPAGAGQRPRDDDRAPASGALRESAFLLRKAASMWPRVGTAYAAAWRGHVVLCDRHPVEVLAIQPPRTQLGAALERLLFTRLVPAPDRIVVLDAPGAVLFERKGEHDPELLERWRQAYLSTFVPPGAVVPTTGPVEESVQSLLHVLWQELCRRNGWSPTSARAAGSPVP